MKTHKEKQMDIKEEVKKYDTIGHEFTSDLVDNSLVGIDISNPLDAIRAIVAEPGFTYEWQRYKLRDKQDSAYAFAISTGWQPIDKAKLPNKFNLEIFEIYNPDPIAQKFICHGDLILMRIATPVYEKLKYDRANIARKSVEMADSFGYDVVDPTRNVMKNN